MYKNTAKRWIKACCHCVTVNNEVIIQIKPSGAREQLVPQNMAQNMAHIRSESSFLRCLITVNKEESHTSVSIVENETEDSII